MQMVLTALACCLTLHARKYCREPCLNDDNLELPSISFAMGNKYHLISFGDGEVICAVTVMKVPGDQRRKGREIGLWL